MKNYENLRLIDKEAQKCLHIFGAGYTVGGLLLRRKEVMILTMTIVELLAVLGLLIQVISLCCIIFSKDK